MQKITYQFVSATHSASLSTMPVCKTKQSSVTLSQTLH